MLSSQAREHFKSKATWKGYEFINGKKRRRVQYLDNVAKLGSEIVNNQDRKIERDCQVVLSDEFTKRRSSQRQLPIEEAVKARHCNVALQPTCYGDPPRIRPAPKEIRVGRGAAIAPLAANVEGTSETLIVNVVLAA